MGEMKSSLLPHEATDLKCESPAGCEVHMLLRSSPTGPLPMDIIVATPPDGYPSATMKLSSTVADVP